jgi:putative ABC transport system substrate-binding protein
MAAPKAAGAQNTTLSSVGYLSSDTRNADASQLRATLRGLSELGFVEGKNLNIEFHWSDGGYDQMSSGAAALVARKVDVILAAGLPAALAAQVATSTIPVFRFAVDPVAYRMVRSFDHPGGNLTGVTSLYDPLTSKKFQLLSELVSESSFGFLVNPKNPDVKSHDEQAEAAARTLKLRLTRLTASSASEIETAFASAHDKSVTAVLVGDDPLLYSLREELIKAAAHYRIPTMYWKREFPDVGGLISYGPNSEVMSYFSGQYIGRLLKRAKPEDLPVQQPTKFELVINVKTANALGLTVPPTLLARADEVIE